MSFLDIATMLGYGLIAAVVAGLCGGVLIATGVGVGVFLLGKIERWTQ